MVVDAVVSTEEETRCKLDFLKLMVCGPTKNARLEFTVVGVGHVIDHEMKEE